MTRKKTINKVIKIPLEKKTYDYPQKFPRMPRLYLEIIENKSKIKQELINKEHVVDETTLDDLYNRKEFNPQNKYNNNEYRESKYYNVNEERRRDENRYEERGDDRYEERDDDRQEERGEDRQEERDEDIDANSVSESQISNKLNKLLNDDNQSVHSNVSKYSRRRDSRSGHSIHNHTYFQTRKEAPTLAQLQQQGAYVPKQEYNNLQYTNTEQHNQEDLKREILFKFELLKKSYPSSVIPEYTVHSEYTTIKRSYDETVRRLSLDSSVESYKTYLIGCFMGCEFLFGNFLGFDMEGFTQQQIVSMNSYERLLIEIGEKSYVPTGSKWPVELRLLFLVIMNAAFFICSKMIMKKTGANLLGMINKMNSSQKIEKPKKRMRGPTTDFENLN